MELSYVTEEFLLLKIQLTAKGLNNYFDALPNAHLMRGSEGEREAAGCFGTFSKEVPG